MTIQSGIVVISYLSSNSFVKSHVLSATIEFSEILEQSRAVREELNILKKYIIKESISASEKGITKSIEIENVVQSPVEPQLDVIEPLNAVEEKIENQVEETQGSLVSFSEFQAQQNDVIQEIEPTDMVEEIEELEEI